MMPEMDGFTLAEQVRRHGSLDATRLIMLSSAMQASDRRRAREVGYVAYLTKPLCQSELLNVMTRSVGPAVVEEELPPTTWTPPGRAQQR